MDGTRGRADNGHMVAELEVVRDETTVAGGRRRAQELHQLLRPVACLGALVTAQDEQRLRGIDNPLFYDPKTSMSFGDTKASVSEVLSEVQAL